MDFGCLIGEIFNHLMNEHSISSKIYLVISDSKMDPSFIETTLFFGLWWVSLKMLLFFCEFALVFQPITNTTFKIQRSENYRALNHKECSFYLEKKYWCICFKHFCTGACLTKVTVSDCALWYLYSRVKIFQMREYFLFFFVIRFNR